MSGQCQVTGKTTLIGFPNKSVVFKAPFTLTGTYNFSLYGLNGSAVYDDVNLLGVQQPSLVIPFDYQAMNLPNCTLAIDPSGIYRQASGSYLATQQLKVVMQLTDYFGNNATSSARAIYPGQLRVVACPPAVDPTTGAAWPSAIVQTSSGCLCGAAPNCHRAFTATSVTDNRDGTYTIIVPAVRAGVMSLFVYEKPTAVSYVVTATETLQNALNFDPSTADFNTVRGRAEIRMEAARGTPNGLPLPCREPLRIRPT